MNANTPLRRREPDRGPLHAPDNGPEPSVAHSKHRNRARHEGINMLAHAATGTATAAAEVRRVEASRAGASKSGATWTSERVEQLKGCIGAGLTCSQIAAEIGVTRNAVIGKMNRLGLSRPKGLLAREPQRKRAALRPRSGTGIVTRLFGQRRILMELPPAPLEPAEAIVIHDGRGCSLLELGPGKCRWPISEPGTADFCFCGNSQVEGLPYCVGHARLAYRSAARARSGARV